MVELFSRQISNRVKLKPEGNLHEKQNPEHANRNPDKPSNLRQMAQLFPKERGALVSYLALIFVELTRFEACAHPDGKLVERIHESSRKRK